MNITVAEPLGGFKNIEFYLLTEVSGWPDVITDDNACTLVFTPEDVGLCGDLMPESIEVTDKPSDDVSGKTWEVSAQFVFTGRNAALEQIAEQYCGLPGIALAHHNEGWCKLLGTKEEPVYMAFSNDYGTKPESAGGVTFTIKGTQSQRPVFYVTP